MTKIEFSALLVLRFIASSLLPLVNIILAQRQLPSISISNSFGVPMAFDMAFFVYLSVII